LSLKDVGFFVYTRVELDRLSEITDVDISSGNYTEQQFWAVVREKLSVERVLAEITAFIDPDASNERTRTSVRNRLRNELQNVTDPTLADTYPVPKNPEQVRAALTACIARIDEIVDAGYGQCFRCVLQRAVADSFVLEAAATTANDDGTSDSERLKRLAEETYRKCFRLVLADGFDDQELSGRAALSFFYYCRGDLQRCSDVLGPCLRHLENRDDWLDVCAGAMTQELSRNHHAGMLHEVDHDLCEYVAGLAAGGSVFVSSAALAFYLSVSSSAFGGDRLTHERLTRLQQLEEHLAAVASGGLLFQHLVSSCKQLRRLAAVKHRQLMATSTAQHSTAY